MLSQFSDKYPWIKKKLFGFFVVDIDPNIVSLIGLIAAVAAGYFFYRDMLVLGGLFVLLNGILDLLDGEIAKAYCDKRAALGDFLDHVFDRLADIFIFLGITLSPRISMGLGFVTMVSVVLVSYLGTQAQALIRKRLYGGIMGRADRHAIIILASFLIFVSESSLFYYI